MLDQNDLKQIRSIIQDETRAIVQSETRAIVQAETRAIIQAETRAIVREETRAIVREETHAIIQQELKPIKKDIAQIRRDQNTIIKFFNEEILSLRERVERIEEFLKLSPLN